MNFFYFLATFFIIFFSLTQTGCVITETFSLIFAEQSWSPNYACQVGVVCTSPKMIDGELETVGYTASDRSILITFPKVINIHRILLKNTNIKSFIIYVARNAQDAENWKKIIQIQNNEDQDIDLKHFFRTNRIRILVGRTMNDKRTAGELYRSSDGTTKRRSFKLGKPYVHEIELYGLTVSKANNEDQPTF